MSEQTKPNQTYTVLVMYGLFLTGLGLFLGHNVLTAAAMRTCMDECACKPANSKTYMVISLSHDHAKHVPTRIVFSCLT